MEHFKCFVLACFVFSVAAKDVLTTDGDIILGGLFPIHRLGPSEGTCGHFNAIPGYQYMESMLYAVDKINKRQDILPGIKLGTIIYDTCESPTIAGDRTKEFIKVTLSPSTTNGSQLAGVIGSAKSTNSIIVANFLRAFCIPQISYASATAELSNKELYNYFFRTVPPSSFFARALVTLLQRLGWTYVSIVYSTGAWAETGAEEVIKVLMRSKICIAQKKQLRRFPTEKDYTNVVKKLVGDDDDQPSVVVLVTTHQDSRWMLRAKKGNTRAFRLLFVSGIGWNNNMAIVKNLEEITTGTILFGHRGGPLPDFINYFTSLQFSNYSRNNKKWIGEYLQEMHRCKLTNFSVPSDYRATCTGNEEMTLGKEQAPVQTVINAVQAMANALDALQKHLCPGTRKVCKKMRPLPRGALLKFLQNVTFKDAIFQYPVTFNAKHEVDANYTIYNFQWVDDHFSYTRVGLWAGKLNSAGSITGTLFLNQSQLRWANGSKIQPLSTCRPDCHRNEINVERDDKCCWKCKACGLHDVIENNTCQTCAEGFIPHMSLSTCLKLPLKFVNMDTPLSIISISLSSLGILTVLVVLAVFITKRHHRLIKASGCEMCYIMLLGIIAVFLVPFTFLIRPTENLCYFQLFSVGISFTICYAPLLMKVRRIYRIFTESINQFRRLSAKSALGLRCQLTITLSLIVFQGLFCALTLSTDPPTVVEKFYSRRKELVLECSLKKSVFLILFICNIVLALCCTFYAFLTRNFPKNFNEAMCIGITMYLTCAVWIVFSATFLNVNYSISRVYWISVSSLVIGWVTLLGLFAPKLYQLCTKTEFNTEMLINWDKSAVVQVEISDAISGSVCPLCRMRYNESSKSTGGIQEIPGNDHKESEHVNIASTD